MKYLYTFLLEGANRKNDSKEATNSINENTNNSIEGNTYLYVLQNKNTQQYLNELAVSFGPLSDQTLTNKSIWLMMRLTSSR